MNTPVIPNESDPNVWIPIINGKYLLIKANDLEVKISDRDLGEFTYHTDLLKIDGVDLRVFGNNIRCNTKKAEEDNNKRTIFKSFFKKRFCNESNNNTANKSSSEENRNENIQTQEIVVEKEKDKDKYTLCVKGGQLRVSDIRYSNIEKIVVKSGKFAAEVNQNNVKAPNTNTLNPIKKDYKLLSALIFLFAWLIFLTALPCVCFVRMNNCFYAKQNDDINASQDNTKTEKEKTTSNGKTLPQTPAIAKNQNTLKDDTNNVPGKAEPQSSVKDLASSLLPKQAIGQGGVLNHYHVSVYGENVISNVFDKSDKNTPVSINNNLLIMLVAALLYIIFYCINAYLMLKALHEFNRQGKMTRDMSGVLRALENEKNKEKRKEMQKKILDDMINTYLDKRTIED